MKDKLEKLVFFGDLGLWVVGSIGSVILVNKAVATVDADLEKPRKLNNLETDLIRVAGYAVGVGLVSAAVLNLDTMALGTIGVFKRQILGQK